MLAHLTRAAGTCAGASPIATAMWTFGANRRLQPTLHMATTARAGAHQTTHARPSSVRRPIALVALSFVEAAAEMTDVLAIRRAATTTFVVSPEPSMRAAVAVLRDTAAQPSLAAARRASHEERSVCADGREERGSDESAPYCDLGVRAAILLSSCVGCV